MKSYEKKNFERDVIERSRPTASRRRLLGRLVWAGAAGSALRSKPRLKKRAGKIDLAKIDARHVEHILAAKYGIQSIPTVAVFRDGEVVTGFVGAHPASAIGQFLDDVVEQHGAAVEVA